MLKLLFCLFFLVGAPALAERDGGTTVTDGGHGTRCATYNRDFRLRMPKIETLDLYEARQHYGHRHWRPAAEPAAHSMRHVCKILRERSERMSSVLHGFPELQSAFERACDLGSQLKFASHLPRTNDAGELISAVQPKCRMFQLGLRRSSDSEAVVFIDQKYKQHLSHLEMAAILLHETLHENFNNDSTRAIRQFVMYSLASPRFQRENVSAIRKLVQCKCSLNPDEFVRPNP